MNTIVFLCGDNGGRITSKPARPHGFFGPNLNPRTGKRLRAGKGSLYEGDCEHRTSFGGRGLSKLVKVSEHLMCFQDVMPTLAQLAEAACPDTDGVSFLPTLLGEDGQKTRTCIGKTESKGPCECINGRPTMLGSSDGNPTNYPTIGKRSTMSPLIRRCSSKND